MRGVITHPRPSSTSVVAGQVLLTFHDAIADEGGSGSSPDVFLDLQGIKIFEGPRALQSNTEELEESEVPARRPVVFTQPHVAY